MVDDHEKPFRACRICGETKPVEAFRTGPQGRRKSLCTQCMEDLITAHLGPGVRKCVTCGRPIKDYRCRPCWKKVRSVSDCSGMDPEDVFHVKL